VPIYWAPAGSDTFPPGYENVIDRFIANVAAARGGTDNVFSVATEYYSDQFGIKRHIADAIRAGTRIVDTHPFPANGCSPHEGFDACVTDGQIRAELRRLVASRKLPADLAHVYSVFLPPKVETTNIDGTNSAEDFCAYHSAFASGGGHVVYTNQPFNEGMCGSGQAPNGNVAADSVIAIFSHELIEAMTDPLDTPRAWDDRTGNEVADLCAGTYGRPLGSTKPANASSTEYNQIINGGHYYLPQEFSNLAFDRFGPDRGCVLSEKIADSATAAALGRLEADPRAFVIDATPAALPTPGQGTSKIEVRVSDTRGDGLAGDRVHFHVQGDAGIGNCGSVSSTDQTTGADGRVGVTYTPSRDGVACWVLAQDTEGGRSAAAAVYQGKTASDSPTVKASFPAALVAGGGPATFTITTTNRASFALPETLTHLVFFAGEPGAGGVTAGQVHLSYSAKTTKGKFVAIPLLGSTTSGGAIQGFIGPLRGTSLAPRSSDTLTLHISVDRGVPVSKSRPLLTLHGFLSQTDPASGSTASLADTGAASITVPAAAAPSNTGTILIAVAAGLVLLGLGGGALWRARRAAHTGERDA
jgi:hypothetical protein